MVGSPARDEVAGKSCWKKPLAVRGSRCRWLPRSFVMIVTQLECVTIVGWVAGIDHTAKP